MTRSGTIEWMSTREAAEHLGITTRTLYHLINEGQLPGYKIGRVIRLKAEEVEAFIEGARIEPGTLDHLSARAGEHGLEVVDAEVS